MALAQDKIDMMQYLVTQDIAIVSTVNSDGKPMAATVYFTVDDKFNFYFMTKNFSRKYKNLEQNGAIAMVVGAQNEPVTVQIEGTAEEIVDKDDFNKIFRMLEKIFQKNTYVAPLFQLSPDDNRIVIFKVTPNWIRWLDLREEKTNGEFVQIMP